MGRAGVGAAMSQGDRKRNQDGQYVETVTRERVLAALKDADEPIMATGDVADALKCSREAARLKLTELAEDGEVERRNVRGAVVVWWPTDDPTTAEPLRDLVGMLNEDEADAFEERTREVRDQFDREIHGDDAPGREA
jgi:DNA-binding FadR family transcriptional regulator